MTMNLAIGITTAPRPRPTFDQTVRELRAAGFSETISVMAEPGSTVGRFPNVEVHWNAERQGLWRNWLKIARTLLHQTTAEFLLICEDDLWVADGAAATMRAAMEELPRETWGYASLYTPRHNIAGGPVMRGWQALDRQSLWGALAYCFTRESLRELLHSSVTILHPFEEGTDSVVPAAMQALGRRGYYHVPSLCAHAGSQNSSVGHPSTAGMEAVEFENHLPAAPSRVRANPARRQPLVSCIMVTGDRREFALQSIEYFQRQNYSAKELVIVDDGHDGLAECLPADDRLKCVRVPAGLTVGAKRNRACEVARGTFIAFWDDDDWYGPERLTDQLRPLIEGDHDISGFTDTIFFDLADWEFRRCTPELHRRLFRENVHGGTLVFRRSVWERIARFPDVSIAEDAHFLQAAVTRGARLCRRTAERHFVYVRHHDNAWRMEFGGDDWTSTHEPLEFSADREFYRRRRRIVRNAVSVVEPACDCLARTEITPPPATARRELCLATVVSPGFEHHLDDLLGSFLAYGNCPQALIAVFAVGRSERIDEVCRKYDALQIACQPVARVNAAVKSVLYSVARIVNAERFVCVDADMLVLNDLTPVFDAIVALPGTAILACRESNSPMYDNLRHALGSVYEGADADIASLLGRDRGEGQYPLVVNDGLFAGSRSALLELDETIRRMRSAPAWVDEKPHVSWRNQFVFNLALATRGCGFELAPTFNVQLNYQDCDAKFRDGRVSATWDDRPVEVLHFNGVGRDKYREMRGLFQRVDRPLQRAPASAPFDQFRTALRAWVGIHGLDALAWTFYGTGDGRTAREPDAGEFPLFGLLYHLLRSSGCATVVETGTGYGVSSACMAAAVHDRPGARVATIDVQERSERSLLWKRLPPWLQQCLEPIASDSIEALRTLRDSGAQFDAALLDSVHAAEHVYDEFVLAAQLVRPGGLILIHDVFLDAGSVGVAVDRIQADGYGVARLWPPGREFAEDVGLGLAVIENERRQTATQNDMRGKR